jgi:hypothetical protein
MTRREEECWRQLGKVEVEVKVERGGKVKVEAAGRTLP